MSPSALNGAMRSLPVNKMSSTCAVDGKPEAQQHDAPSSPHYLEAMILGSRSVPERVEGSVHPFVVPFSRRPPNGSHSTVLRLNPAE